MKSSIEMESFQDGYTTPGAMAVEISLMSLIVIVGSPASSLTAGMCVTMGSLTPKWNLTLPASTA